MRQFGTSGRVVLVVARVLNHIAFRLADMGDVSGRGVEVFLPLDEHVIAVERTGHVFDGDVE